MLVMIIGWQEASPSNVNTLSPYPDDDDDDDDDDISNNDVDDDGPSYGFAELSLPDMSHDTSETFNSSAELTDSFYSQWINRPLCHTVVGEIGWFWDQNLFPLLAVDNYGMFLSQGRSCCIIW